ncbi:hypothetical protein I6E74_02970 [Salinibacterium sp. SWN139]|uniref:hypothetical protein n=1 Tax=Salinibacterium sp. SWN139 TaxID=2792055 RepID=UPI0018CF9417|nr:hypothetical protein [Salinibacterium sp. SWN139]MBH0053131.1 hypothetical protein [Salinibacterium sp. SWN139]
MDSTQQARVLGRTFGLEEVAPGARIGLDLALDSTAGGRDLRIETGADALAQDLKVALLTPLGGDVLHRRFGFEGLTALTRGGGARLSEELLRLATMRVIAADSRIAAVLNVRVVRDDPGRRLWRIVVQARTVTDQVIDVTWEEVGSDG